MGVFTKKTFGDHYEFIVDTEADLQDVPTVDDGIEPGSIAIVLTPEDGHSQYRMLNTEGDWIEILTPPTTIAE